MKNIEKLKDHAYAIRLNALKMGEVQGQGYIGQALGIADVLSVIYFHALKYDPNNIKAEDRDRFLLSIGHYAIGLYAALLEAKILPIDELETYGSDDSRLPMSGMATYTPGMEISGGSLGQGLGIAVGMALALKRKKSKSFIFNLMSDGELDEGPTWEAAMSAGHWSLDNLIALIDVNNQQADGPSKNILNFEPLSEKWESFGWHVQRVDGNNLLEILSAVDIAKSINLNKPRVIICDTLMGCGVKFLEQREKNHFIRVDDTEWALAINTLERR